MDSIEIIIAKYQTFSDNYILVFFSISPYVLLRTVKMNGIDSGFLKNKYFIYSKKSYIQGQDKDYKLSLSISYYDSLMLALGMCDT